MVESVTVEVTGGDRDHVQRVIDDIRRLTVELRVFRATSSNSAPEVFRPPANPFHFVDRPHIARDT
jgi:hypothetical protein